MEPAQSAPPRSPVGGTKDDMLKHSATVFVACALLLTGCLAQDAKKRQAVVAGSFYPSDPGLLSRMVDDYLNAAKADSSLGDILGLVVPHAGYVYSGPVAAAGFVQLKGKKIDRVILIAPSHVERLAPGAAIYDGDYYQTPLGDVPVDTAFARKLAAIGPLFQLTGAGHETRTQDGRGEHAIEVQLPFLQRVLGSFKIVPIVVGDQRYQTCRSLGIALAGLIDGPNTVIIASSDLAHFHDYAQTVAMDTRLLAAVSEGDYLGVVRNLERGVWEACGGGPIVATMMAAERLGGGQARVIKQANSGDSVAGDRTRVVGYAAVAFTKSPSVPGQEYALGKAEQDRLLEIAGKSVE
ncbi:MAG: AmmeMemoRadiSam system protein B, partial [Acidobacteria bacterium]